MPRMIATLKKAKVIFSKMCCQDCDVAGPSPLLAFIRVTDQFAVKKTSSATFERPIGVIELEGGTFAFFHRLLS